MEKAAEEELITDVNQLPGQKQDTNKQRKLRLVVDFRHVNSRIKALNTCWPSPTIFQMLGQLHNARFVSTMDISQGFFHYALDESSKNISRLLHTEMQFFNSKDYRKV